MKLKKKANNVIVRFVVEFWIKEMVLQLTEGEARHILFFLYLSIITTIFIASRAEYQWVWYLMKQKNTLFHLKQWVSKPKGSFDFH